MGQRHPLPYAFAKAHTLLLEDDGQQLTLWAGEHASATALSEVLRVYDVKRFEREPLGTLAQPSTVAASAVASNNGNALTLAGAGTISLSGGLSGSGAVITTVPEKLRGARKTASPAR